MPAKSKAQQRFMGMVYSSKKTGKDYGGEVARAAASMSTEDAKDFASTKHDKLPTKKAFAVKLASRCSSDIPRAPRYTSAGKQGKKVMPLPHAKRTKKIEKRAFTLMNNSCEMIGTIKSDRVHDGMVTARAINGGLICDTELEKISKLNYMRAASQREFAEKLAMMPMAPATPAMPAAPTAPAPQPGSVPATPSQPTIPATTNPAPVPQGPALNGIPQAPTGSMLTQPGSTPTASGPQKQAMVQPSVLQMLLQRLAAKSPAPPTSPAAPQSTPVKDLTQEAAMT